jgi:hypothetical protein
MKMPPAATYFSIGTCADPKPNKVRLVADLLGVPFDDAVAAFVAYHVKFPTLSWEQAGNAFLAEARAFGAMPVGRPLWAASRAWPMPDWPPVFRGGVLFWSFVLTLLILLAVIL